MRNANFDPGLTQQFTRPMRRAINKDGSFNVHRRGATWHDFHPYLALVDMSWPRFLGVLFLAYAAVNLVFACIYYAAGPGQLDGIGAVSPVRRFWGGFFFSAHTLSTVGYGNIWPKGMAANVVAAFESLAGVLGFAVATGLLFGRVSRPSARIGFSGSMVVAPYQEITSLQFRVVNRRKNDLMDLESRVMLMVVENGADGPRRTYNLLRLEREQVMFLPLTWTVVHPIDAESPLHGCTAADLERMQAEVMILIKAYDDTFAQNVVARHSYRYDEIVWNRRFAPAFHVDEAGDMELELRKVGDSVTAEAPGR